MFRRPATTILLITNEEVVRADFGSGRKPRPLGLWRREAAGTNGLRSAAELAISLGPKLGSRVLVLTTTAWTQTISIAARSVEGMSDDELQESLKFEVEAFSGLSALDSALAHRETQRPSADEREFWVNQLDRSDLEELQSAVTGRGAKLMGVCNPAGMPVSTSGSETWKRMEFWNDVVCCIRGGAGLKVFIANTDPRSDRWQSALENWYDNTDATEWLVGPSTGVPHEYLGDGVVDLADEGMQRWMQGWASHLASGTPQVPVLRPARKQVSREVRIVSSAVIAILMFALCFAHWSFTKYVSGTIQREKEALEGPKQEKKQIDQKLAEIEKSLPDLEKKLEELSKVRRGIGAFTSARSRFSELLKSLAAFGSEDLVIEKVSPDQRGIVISGTSLSADAAAQLARGLRGSLTESGWDVALPTQEGTNKLANGGPWTYEIVLQDVAPPDEAASGNELAAKRQLELRNAKFDVKKQD